MTDKDQLELDIKFVRSTLTRLTENSFRQFDITTNKDALEALDKFENISQAAWQYLDLCE